MSTQLPSAEAVYSTPATVAQGITAPQAVVLQFYRHGPGRVPAQLVGQPKGAMPTETASGPAAIAQVNHGRWTVECPFPRCHSAQYASEGDRRFFCVECGNAGIGKWVPVTWPSAVDLATIEAALSLRADVRTRNWAPPETVQTLLDENAGHLVPAAIGTMLPPPDAKAT